MSNLKTPNSFLKTYLIFLEDKKSILFTQPAPGTRKQPGFKPMNFSELQIFLGTNYGLPHGY
jgi:hypothetical protein